MKISNEYPTMVFKKEYNGKVYYSLGMSRKKQDGTYENAYIDCRFKQGVELDNQTNIYVNDGFMSFYLKDGKPIYYLVITDFKKVADVIQETSVESLKQDEISIDLDDLPF